jgi:hypothetical protein
VVGEIRRVTVAVGVLLAIVLTGCAGPTIRDQAVYNQAEKSATAMVSELRTVLVATKVQLASDSWWRYADVVVTDSETSATSIQSTFTSRQPPSRSSNRIYADTSTALSDAADLVTQMRVALRQRDVPTMEKLRPKIAKAAADLESLEKRARTH